MAIRAVLFDLDGTLVQSEKLKALSYAIAVQRLLDLPEPDDRAVEAYREIVGASREVASQHIVDRLGLAGALASHSNGAAPTDVLTGMRVEIYNAMVADPNVIKINAWPHNVALLRWVRERGCKTGLATMSHRPEALHVLDALDVRELLDVVSTREDVREPKPSPEIYRLTAERLGVASQETLVIEDSPAGVQAGVASGAHVIGVATPFTERRLQAAEPLPGGCVVYEPHELMGAVGDLLARVASAGRPAASSPLGG